MGAMFRSEEMALCQLFIQPEAAYTSVSELGEAGTVQFRDFVNEVRRCDEMERKLRYVEAEVHKDGVHIPQAHLEKTENEILELSHNAVNLKQNFLELTELKHVLEKTEAFFTAQEEIGMDSLTKSLISDETGHQAATRGRLGFVAGVVNRERVPAFERMLWRISRGNGNEIYKTVFVAFFQGEQLKSRIKKVCTGFHASLYPCPPSNTERQDMRVLASVAKELASWSVMVRKMKAIYHTLNLFNMDVTKKCLIGECWVPTADLPNVQKALADGSNACGSSIPSFLNCIETDEEPPTFNRTNRFTRGFQNLIDSYGGNEIYKTVFVAFFQGEQLKSRIKKVCTGFHASLYPCPPSNTERQDMVLNQTRDHRQRVLASVAKELASWSVMVRKMKAIYHTLNLFNMDVTKKCLIGECWVPTADLPNVQKALADGSNACGSSIPSFLNCIETDEEPPTFNRTNRFTRGFQNLIDSYGSMNIFGSSWQVPYDNATMAGSAALTLDPKDAYLNAPYFIGMDPIWQTADNKIIFLNSYKMKLSIIFDPAYRQGCAPSVLILFINMMLFSSTEPEDGCSEFMFEGQGRIQRAFVLVGLCCIPVMLLGKPLYLLAASKKKDQAKPEHSNGAVNQGIEMQEQTDIEGSSKPEEKAGAHGHEEEPFSEIMIHQAIHTIEYFGLKDDNYIGAIKLYVAFGFWAIFTLAILVMMEGLSAFLHTLRLHWVVWLQVEDMAADHDALRQRLQRRALRGRHLHEQLLGVHVAAARGSAGAGYMLLLTCQRRAGCQRRRAASDRAAPCAAPHAVCLRAWFSWRRVHVATHVSARGGLSAPACCVRQSCTMRRAAPAPHAACRRAWFSWRRAGVARPWYMEHIPAQ
ncbi:V-type proton ATPase subunit a [Operophtera brumata]|uniref:V-type proton ATPase subunit a n=1 Tax=Operophtera brumata TaxID=104452 RepID=A0A0L7L3H4_OPEBR|nr:V-type proton ATPase subunit a [Operophtera brumata]